MYKTKLSKMENMISLIRKGKILIFISFLVTVFACQKGDKKNLENDVEARITEYYPDGKVKVEYTVKNKKWNGKAKFYLNNGQLKCIETYKNSKKDGWAYYYKNGNIYKKIFYKNDLRRGPYFEYYKNQKGVLHFKVNYLVVAGKEVVTDFIEYSPTGEIIEQSSKVKINVSSDSAFIGDSIRVSLEILNPEFDKMRVYVEGFDEQFYIKDSLKLKVLDGHNSKVSFIFIPDSLGWQAIRGFASDYKIIKRYKDGSYETKSKDIYFEHKIYIKKTKVAIASL
jgi:hypothetical protein